MRGCCLGFVLTVAVLFPKIGTAQVFQFRTPPPDVSAAGAEWQMNSAPVIVGGLTYYPTRGFRMFDGQVMAQTGMFENVPVYSDATLEPYSELYVPVGSGRMRIYERRRERELAGTTGSHVPAFPVASPSVPAPRERSVGTAGSAVPRAVAGSAILPDRGRPRRTILTAVSRTSATNGVWIEFRGVRWYSKGAAAMFSPDRFEPIGEYHGFPVYRDKTGAADDIWVSAVTDGPVAPYARR